ncbi:GRIP and coiled-coil domain-containing protein 2 [Ochlerotatus camptorhynchus]|uniref:GRIP and coiled-coil domain-containing protein 2 n=1 Tax=Ochlerotatus camptorhynchus TaxID=644619 RepID=UPI0031D9C455
MEGNVSSDQDSVGGAKKASPFDNLTREDLIKKCRGLLGIAQKAKQAKDECQEENRKLKEQLSQAETQKTADKDCLKAMQEMVSSLTEQKLQAAMKADELQKMVAGLRRELDGAALLREQLEKFSVENEAFQRQIKRLTDENEELLGDLSGMEAKMQKLEGEKEKLKESKVVVEQELLKAKGEGVLTGKEEKLIRKLKLYKNKVQDISAKVLLLKSDRKILLKTVKEYSEQVPKWQKELLNASNVLFTRMQALERENTALKNAYKSKEQKTAEMEDSTALADIQKLFEELQQTYQSLEAEKGDFELTLKQQSQEKEVLERKIAEMESIIAERQSVIDELKSGNEDLNVKKSEIEEKLQLELADKRALVEKIEALQADSVLGQSELRKQLKMIQEQFSNQAEELKAKNVLLSEFEQKLQRESDENEKCENLQKSLAEVQDILSNKEAQLQQLQKKLQDSMSILESLQGQYEVSAAQNQQLQAVNDALISESSAFKSELQTVTENLKTENEHLQKRLQQSEMTSKQLAEKIEELKSTTVQGETELNKRLNELQEQTAKQMEELETKHVQLTELEEKQKFFAEAQDALSEKEDQLQELQKKQQESTFILEDLQGRYDALEAQNHQLQATNDALSSENSTGKSELQTVNENMKTENGELLKRLQETEMTSKQLAEKIETLIAATVQDESELQKRLEQLQELSVKQAEELDARNVQLSQFEQKLKKEDEQNEKCVSLQKSIAELQVSLSDKEGQLQQLQKELQETTSTLEGLQGRHNVLAAQNQQLQATNDALSNDNSTYSSELQSVQSKFELIKLENSELLSELKEINEILKERGGVISLQLSKISELEAQKLALQQKLNELDSPDVGQLRQRAQDLERQLNERESELAALRDRDRNFDAQSDVMSTSTISRAEESARMREIDDSFEEKYNKLRSLAVKLKKKVAEQTIQLQKFEKERETQAVGKNFQSLQAEYDRVLDQMEAERKITEHLEAEMKELKEHVEKQQQEIETMNQVRSEMDNSSKKDKSSLESTIREYREQLQSLKREKEAFNLAKKEIDTENQKLKATLKATEKQLSEELEAQKELKAEVEKCRLAAKKAKVLNLEMEAYEKSLDELNKKLEAKKVHAKDLEGTIEVQEGTIKSLKSQLTLLEQSLNGERSHSQELKKNVDVQQEKLRISEHQRGEMNVELAQLKVEYERIKLEIESNRIELSDAVTEKEKACNIMESEKSKLMKQVYGLESAIEDLKSKMKDKEQEVEDVRTEFASYKIRAQSVLRQNQNKDGGKERQLQEEVQNVQKTLELSQSKLQTFTHQTAELGKTCDELREDKTRLQTRCKELHDLLEESRVQNESLMEENRRSNLNHQEALKTQRLQNETLVNCYKKQIEELQEKHSKEVESLQSHIIQANLHHTQEASNDFRNNNNNTAIPSSSGMAFFRGQHISDEQKINLLLMEREEGEGSESITSHHQNPSVLRRKSSNSSQPNQRTRSNRELIPLDELLNSSFDDASVFEADSMDLSGRPSVSPTVELQQTKEKLSKQESRVRHLAALLAEAEQDLAKLTQLNELLKEEVRRHERAIEREKHVHNSEYLKNVIFKFLTLNSGDEKSHLVPVLNTILRLSPEETQKLNSVARGTDGGGRGWTGILWN